MTSAGKTLDDFLRGAIREFRKPVAPPVPIQPVIQPPRPERRTMSKLSALTEALADTTQMLDAEADKVLALLQETNAQAPAAFDKARNYVLSKRQEVEGINKQLQQLTNLPLEGSGGSMESSLQESPTSPNGKGS